MNKENKEKNKEKKVEYNKKWYQLNKEKLREKRAEYYKKWYQLNKEQIRENNTKYRKERRAYCREYLGGKCVVCGTTHNLQFDHIKREG